MTCPPPDLPALSMDLHSPSLRVVIYPWLFVVTSVLFCTDVCCCIGVVVGSTHRQSPLPRATCPRDMQGRSYMVVRSGWSTDHHALGPSKVYIDIGNFGSSAPHTLELPRLHGLSRFADTYTSAMLRIPCSYLRLFGSLFVEYLNTQHTWFL